MIHIVQLDLSKNALTELPVRFGSLSRLQHLDLLGNQLTTLPVSMAKLNNLKWMDIKDNPLNQGLVKVVGDCLDDVQCRQSAKNVSLLPLGGLCAKNTDVYLYCCLPNTTVIGYRPAVPCT